MSGAAAENPVVWCDRGADDERPDLRYNAALPPRFGER